MFTPVSRVTISPLLKPWIVLSGGSENTWAVTRSSGRRYTCAVGPNWVIRPLKQSCRIAAEKQRLRRVGRGVDEDGAGSREDAGQLLAQLLAEFIVKIGKRLVEQHELRALHEGAGNRRALLLPARQLERAATELRLEPSGSSRPREPGPRSRRTAAPRRAAARRCFRRR